MRVALTFLLVNLIVPAVRTIITSFLDRDSEAFVGLDNYEELVTSQNFLDWRSWSGDDGTWNVLTSQLFWLGLFLLIASHSPSRSTGPATALVASITRPHLGARCSSAASSSPSPSSR